MENKRHDYRHVFAPRDRRHVDLVRDDAAVAPIGGELENLSIGGAAIRLDAAAPVLPRQARIVMRLALGNDAELAVPAEVVHSALGPSRVHGVRFLPLPEPSATEARERAVGKFLLEQQRRARRNSA